MQGGDGKFPWGNVWGEDHDKGPDKGAVVPWHPRMKPKSVTLKPFKASRKKCMEKKYISAFFISLVQ